VYISALLLKIRFAKEAFVMDIAEGIETLIPKTLSQGHMPYSFRYYDSVLSLIHNMAPDDRRQFFKVQKQVAFSIHRTMDLKQKIYEWLGIYESEKTVDKLTTVHSSVYKRNEYDVDHN
jgi:hypothetical protein